MPTFSTSNREYLSKTNVDRNNCVVSGKIYLLPYCNVQRSAYNWFCGQDKQTGEASMNISKTVAIKESSKSVSIHGYGTCWVVVGPYHSSEPNGPYTEQQYSTYTKALRAAASWKATIAVALMGLLNDDSEYAIDRAEHEDGIANVRDLVAIGINASQVQA
jgi:hypothetical protein